VLRLIPAPVARRLLPLAHLVRHRWRRWRGAPLRGCAVVIENGAGEILLLRHSYGPEVWALPGGGIGAREAPELAARREMEEELGLRLEGLTLIATAEEVISGSPHTGFLFAATTPDVPRPDRREVIEARFFAPDALPEPLGRITRSRLALWRASQE
jgi:ADP-ribose pyrophosphatase YjhB (NUDIX family)